MNSTLDRAVRLFVEAMKISQTGDFDAAIAAFDEAIRCADADAAAQTLVASAMFNRGVALSFAKRTDMAAAAFGAVVDRFGMSDVPALRYWAGLARYTSGFTLLDAGRREEALTALQAFLREFENSSEPEIRERLASAMYEAARLLRDLGRVDEAKYVITELMHVYGNAPEPAVQAIIAKLLSGPRRNMDVTEPAAHAWADPINVRLAKHYAEMMHASPDDKELYESSLAQLEKAVQMDAERAATLHKDAVAIVEGYRERVEPFALFLRNFALEGSHYGGLGADGEGVFGFFETHAHRVETALGAALKHRLPVVGIANPRFNRPDDEHAFPKLAIPSETWQAALQELVTGASLIVLHLTDLSPGVLAELETIVWLEQQNVTVVILSEPETDDLEVAMKKYYGIAKAEPMNVTEMREQLGVFPRVLHESEVPFDDLGSSWAFADLFEQISFVQSLTVEQRVSHRRITQLNSDANRSLSQGLHKQAVQQLEEARSLYGSLTDHCLRLRTLSLLGTAYYGENNRPASLSAFLEAVALAHELNMPTEEGLFLRDIGAIRQALGEHADAIQSFREALQILNTAKPTAVPGVLRQLGTTYLHADDPGNAAACFEKVLAASDAATDRSDLMHVYMQLGTAYFQLKRHEDVIRALEAAVRLARELEAPEAERLSLRMIEESKLARPQSSEGQCQVPPPSTPA